MFFSRRVVGELMDALDQGHVIPSITGRNAHFDWDAAYKVAAEIMRARRARGEKTVGRKIGFTNRSIWAEYGATAPIWAHVYDGTVQQAVGGHATLSLKGSVQPRIEPEIAFKLKAPLPPGVNGLEHILAAIEWMAPSFEIVDCHLADWKFDPAESAADFSFHWRLVIGTPCPVHAAQIPALVEQLRDCTVKLSQGADVIDEGVGANALGHPAAALAHLAGVLARQPQFEPLGAGEIITTGTLTKAMPIKPGENWTSRYDGLPGVTGLALNLTA